MKTRSIFGVVCALVLVLAQSADAATYTYANVNISATPTTPLDWFTGGPDTQATWSGGTPVSNNGNTIQFFADITTVLGNTAGTTQTANLNNGGAPFELGILTLNGKASAATNLTMTLSGDPLNFSASTGTINLNAVNNTKTLAYNLNHAVQLGTASSVCALTITGGGGSTFNIGGAISELQTGGGSLIKSGTNTVTLSGANTYTGATTINAGNLTLGNLNAIENSSSVSVASGATLQASAVGTYANNTTATIVGTGFAGTPNPGALSIRGNSTYVWNAPLVLGGSATTISSYGSAANVTLGGTIGGTGPLTLSGKGGFPTHTAIWTLNAPSTYAGATTILNSDGLRDLTVKLGVENALPTGTSLNLQGTTSQAVAVFTTLDLNGFNQTLAGLTDTGSSQSQSQGFGKRVINSGATLATLTINNSGNITYGTTAANVLAGTLGGKTDAGVDANNLALAKTGAGTLTLSGTNTYTGRTSINNGTLQISGSGLLGSGSYSAPITNNGTLRYSSSAAQTFSGGISGTGALVKDTSTSTLTLSGTNTYTGATTINAGVLVCNNIKALGNTSAITVNNGAEIYFQGGANGATISAPITLSGNGIGGGALHTYIEGGAITFGAITLGSSSTIYSFAANATLKFNGTINSSGIYDLTFSASGAAQAHNDIFLLQAGSNPSWTGNTIIASTSGANAIVKLEGAALPSTTVLTLKDSNVANLHNDAVLDLNGNNQTLAGLTDTAVGSGGGRFVMNSSNTLATLTISNSANYTYSGVIGLNSTTLNGQTAGSGNIALAKTGAGTLTLSGANTYTGGTTINNGTLKMLTPLPLDGQVMNVLTNPSFETDAGVVNNGNYQAITGWTGGTGIEQGSSRAFAPAAPPNYNASTNYKWAFIQYAQTMSQTMNIPVAGTYKVRFAVVGRAGIYGPLNVQVQIDGVNQSAVITPSQAAWNTYTSSNVVLSAGNHTLSFVFINALGGDRSDSLDDVRILHVPSVSISSSGILDVASQASFTMDGPYTFDINGTQAGRVIANGLTINTAVVNLNIQSMRGPCILATYTNLTGTAFASVTGLPQDYKIDYNYNNAKQIAVLPPPPTIISFF